MTTEDKQCLQVDAVVTVAEVKIHEVIFGEGEKLIYERSLVDVVAK